MPSEGPYASKTAANRPWSMWNHLVAFSDLGLQAVSGQHTYTAALLTLPGMLTEVTEVKGRLWVE